MPERTRYIVLMHRYGEDEGHVYPLGCYDTLFEAKEEGSGAEVERGGKYEARYWRTAGGHAVQREA